MILEEDGLAINGFKRLVDFLDGWGRTENYIKAIDVAEEESDSKEPVIIDSNGNARRRLSPYCKLINAKPSYDGTELIFGVVVEIPKEVSIAWVPKNSNLDCIKNLKSEPYLVRNTEKFLIMLNAIFNSEEPKAALERLGLPTK